MWEYVLEADRPQMTTWRMSIACWKCKAINTCRICNTYSFSAEKMVAQTCLVVHTLPVLWET